MTYICHCTHVDGKVYPDPNRSCPNGHTRGAMSEPITEQEWLGNRPRNYVVPLPPQMRPDEFFTRADEGPITAVPPILVTVQEEFDIRRPRKPIIHWEDVPAGSYDAAMQTIIRQALELRAAGIEPVFTMNGKVVDLNGPLERHL